MRGRRLKPAAALLGTALLFFFFSELFFYNEFAALPLVTGNATQALEHSVAMTGFYVAPKAQGTGLAARLLADGETRLAETGTTRAHLLCLEENTRAARFYDRQGWENLGPRDETLDTLEGPFPLTLLRFEKTLL